MRAVKKKYIIIVAITALVFTGVIGIYAVNRSNKTVTPTRENVLKGNTTNGEPKNYDDGVNSSPSQPPVPSKKPATVIPSAQAQSATLAKPTLQKSSGNAPDSIVANGTAMEFTCEGAPGLNCNIIVTDRNNSNRIIDLGAKIITSNGRGQYFAVWPWQAQIGSWQVVAKTTDNNGDYGISIAQSLEVK